MFLVLLRYVVKCTRIIYLGLVAAKFWVAEKKCHSLDIPFVSKLITILTHQFKVMLSRDWQVHDDVTQLYSQQPGVRSTCPCCRWCYSRRTHDCSQGQASSDIKSPADIATTDGWTRRRAGGQQRRRGGGARRQRTADTRAATRRRQQEPSATASCVGRRARCCTRLHVEVIPATEAR